MRILNSPQIPADALTVPDAANAIGISKQALWERVKRGSVPTYHIASRTLVSLYEAEPTRFEPPNTALELPTDAVPFADVARICEINPSTVLRIARSQHVPTWTVGSLRCVSVADIQTYQENLCKATSGDTKSRKN
jgi:hypothetical protein